MLKLSTRARYGIRMILDLALNSKDRPVLLREIAQRQGISQGYLEQIAPLLKAAGLIKANRGAHGGYLLARDPDDITLKEMIGILEGGFSLVDCIEDPGVCSRLKECMVREIWEEIGFKIAKILDAVTLEEMLRRYQNKKKQNIIYHI
ncbi:MAG: Rrf2 family transcriptional regulator [Candidatus Omnitrophica bacterium]|nr:Rrf2 family transcriptional regulator [Candidatus Omnitrophota bacterium]